MINFHPYRVFSLLVLGLAFSMAARPTAALSWIGLQPTATQPARAAFTLEVKTSAHGPLLTGVSGTIEGVVNPDLVVKPGQTVCLSLLGSQAGPYEFSIPDLQVRAVSQPGEYVEVTFHAPQGGVYPYLGEIAGQRVWGRLVVSAKSR